MDAGSSGAPWVTVSCSFNRLPLCGWVLGNGTDLVTPVTSHPSHLRRVAFQLFLGYCHNSNSLIVLV